MSKRRKPVRAPFVVTFSAVAASAVVVGACGGKVDGEIDPQISVNPPMPPAPPTAARCPVSTPKDGDDCEVSGARCTYPWCGGALTQDFSCDGGRWKALTPSGTCNPPPPECPFVEPRAGAVCSRPGAYCTYEDRCDAKPANAPSRAYTCDGSTWKLASPAYEAKCPATRPKQGEPCGACADRLPASCGYGDCYGYETERATCDPKTGTWSVAFISCNPPPPPPPDGGA